MGCRLVSQPLSVRGEGECWALVRLRDPFPLLRPPFSLLRVSSGPALGYCGQTAGGHPDSVSELWVTLDLRFTLSFLSKWGLDRTTQLTLLPKLASSTSPCSSGSSSRGWGSGSAHHCRRPKAPRGALQTPPSYTSGGPYLSLCLLPLSPSHLSPQMVLKAPTMCWVLHTQKSTTVRSVCPRNQVCQNDDDDDDKPRKYGVGVGWSSPLLRGRAEGAGLGVYAPG